jgi:hypothetical protein
MSDEHHFIPEAGDQAQAEGWEIELTRRDIEALDAMDFLDSEYLRVLRGIATCEGVGDYEMRLLCYGLGIDMNKVI